MYNVYIQCIYIYMRYQALPSDMFNLPFPVAGQQLFPMLNGHNMCMEKTLTYLLAHCISSHLGNDMNMYVQECMLLITLFLHIFNRTPAYKLYPIVGVHAAFIGLLSFMPLKSIGHW